VRRGTVSSARALAQSAAGAAAITAQTVAQVVQARAVAAGFALCYLGDHGLKRGALTTGTDRGIHPAKLKRLGRQKSFDVLGEYLSTSSSAISFRGTFP
jgi:hypothetical protein